MQKQVASTPYLNNLYNYKNRSFNAGLSKRAMEVYRLLLYTNLQPEDLLNGKVSRILTQLREKQVMWLISRVFNTHPEVQVFCHIKLKKSIKPSQIADELKLEFSVVLEALEKLKCLDLIEVRK